MTATEAKTKALQSENIRDERSGTIATGTATDSLLIVATQKEKKCCMVAQLRKLVK